MDNLANYLHKMRKGQTICKILLSILVPEPQIVKEPGDKLGRFF